jgi:HD domain
VPALVRHPLIDELLDARRDRAGGDTAAFEGYRNHAHRVYNFARSISSLSPEDEDKTAIAAAFHDLYAFDGLDYIEPSIEEAGRYLREIDRAVWDREVALMIDFHHRIRPYRGRTRDSSSHSAARTGTTSRWGSSGAASRGSCARPPMSSFR